MTDTVSVPVDLLKELTPKDNDGGAYGSTFLVIQKLKALIPTPAKVGDVLDADEVRQLPTGAVLVDADADVWVRYGVEKVYLAQSGAASNRLPVSNFGPYTVVYLRPGD